MATATKNRVLNRAEAISDERCPRCGGLMIAEQSFGQQSLALMDETASVDVSARRCVQCGEVIDPIILLHRRQASQKIGHTKDSE